MVDEYEALRANDT
jgi:hypothetical protein